VVREIIGWIGGNMGQISVESRWRRIDNAEGPVNGNEEKVRELGVYLKKANVSSEDLAASLMELACHPKRVHHMDLRGHFAEGRIAWEGAHPYLFNNGNELMIGLNPCSDGGYGIETMKLALDYAVAAHEIPYVDDACERLDYENWPFNYALNPKADKKTARNYLLPVVHINPEQASHQAGPNVMFNMGVDNATFLVVSPDQKEMLDRFMEEIDHR
jgi:hypothetical protein